MKIMNVMMMMLIGIIKGQEGNILFGSWVKIVTSYKNAESEYEMPQYFEINPEYEIENNKHRDIPSELDFYLYLLSDSVYILRSQQNDFIHTYRSIPINWIDDILIDSDKHKYMEIGVVSSDGVMDWMKGGLEDMGEYKEGYCVKIETKQSIVYMLCFDTWDQKVQFIKALFQLVHKQYMDIKQKGGLQDQDQRLELQYKSGEIQESMNKESEWVVIHGWTACSVKCGVCVPVNQQQCIGDPILQRTCNLQKCEQLTQKEEKTLAPIIREVRLSDRPQRYEKCVIKEGDLYLALNLKNAKEMPKVPVRMVINNHTISIFANKNYESIFDSFDLQSIQAQKHSGDCFIIKDYQNREKEQQFCIIQSNLRQNQTISEQLQEWLDGIYEFQYQCVQKQRQYQESEFILGLKQRLENEKYELMREERTRKKDKSKEEQGLDIKNRQIVMGLMKEVKLQSLQIKEQQEKQALIRDYIHNKMNQDKHKQDCDQQQQIQNNSQERIQKIGNVYDQLLQDIDINGQKTLMGFKMVGQRQLEILKKINERKLKKEREAMIEVRQGLADDMVDEYRKGKKSSCDPDQSQEQRNSYCQKKVINYQKFKYVYKYMDCLASPSEFCFSCCEVEFGERQQDLRNDCYQGCVKGVKIQNGQVVVNSNDKTNTTDQDCKEKRESAVFNPFQEQ